MDEATIDLSLVVPCYNEAPHLRRCVASLLETLNDLRYQYEVIFVDDKSADQTLAILDDICAVERRCRVIANERNRGRGAAFKIGFAAARGPIVGFLDIDLEIAAHYVAPVVARIAHHGADVAIAKRTNVMTSPSAIGRAIVSRSYQLVTKLALGLEVTDTESGCKFFKRSTGAAAIEATEMDGWFFDTEVVARSLLLGLRVEEVPVLFCRNQRKASTVRLIPDTIKQLRDLHRFRARIGMGLSRKSPVYWSTAIYDRAMDELCGPYDEHVLDDVARRIPDGASVLDVCCGTARLAGLVSARGCSYVGLDFNGAFVQAARRRSLDVRQFDLLRDTLPSADVVVICSSLYHFHDRADQILAKLRAAARRELIVSEPVVALADGVMPSSLRHRLTNPGVGAADFRYDLGAFAELARAHGATLFSHHAGEHNAIAVFAGRAAASRDTREAAEPPPRAAPLRPSSTKAAR